MRGAEYISFLRVIGHMDLKSFRTVLGIALVALTACGCSTHPGPSLRTAAAREIELDSTIIRCRRLLKEGTESAALHSRLAEALLERVVLRENSFTNMVWWGSGTSLYTLRNFGRSPDRATLLSLIDTLRSARAHATRALALAPRDAAAFRVLGRLCMAMGMGMPGDSLYQEATAYFDSSLALDSASAEGYYGLGCSLFKRNMTIKALAALNKSISIDSSRGSTYLTLGEAFLDTGNVTVAFACFENAARLGLTTAGEYLQLSHDYANEATERRLLGTFASLRTKAPGILKPTVRAGLRMLSMYHPGIAIDLASRALEIDSTCAEALLVRASLSLDEGDTAGALDDYCRAFEIGTGSFGYYQGFPRNFLERVYQRIPGSDIVLYILGQSLNTTQESASSPGAIALYQEAAARMPQSVVPAFLLGQAYAIRHDTARAIEWFDRAMALPPQQLPSLYWRMQDMYLDAGQVTKSVEIHKRYLADYGGGWIQELLRQEKRSRRYSREQLSDAAAYCAIGFECSWRIHNGRPEYWRSLAFEQFHRAIEIVPGSAVPYFALGNISIDLGENEEAYGYYRKAASLGSADAKEALRKADAGK
jgi:tetratricopeptide (TPR) repeat protein